MKSSKSQTTLTRIVAGRFKDYTLQVPPVAHPMGTREKNALFNTLASYLPDAAVLDVYAGSGALGIEALSRGASSVIFLEKDPRAAKIIQFNLHSLPAPVNAQVIRRSADNYSPVAAFDIILLDPPYDAYRPADLLHLAAALAPGGRLALSHPAAEPPVFPDLSLLHTKKYARCHLSYFTK